MTITSPLTEHRGYEGSSAVAWYSGGPPFKFDPKYRLVVLMSRKYFKLTHPLPYTFLPTFYSLIFLQFDTVPLQLLTASLIEWSVLNR